MSARGRFVVLLGADGAGKSSVLEGVASLLGPRFAAVEARHYRPQVPWGGGRPVERPHDRPPRAGAASALKLALEVVRFRAGYRRWVRPRVEQGVLVLFDRYYHDVLADPARYRYGGPAWLARWVAGMIPNPDLFIVLDAPVAVLQGRKREVTPEECDAARRAYLALGSGLPGAHVVDAARPLGAVVQEVADLVRAS